MKVSVYRKLLNLCGNKIKPETEQNVYLLRAIYDTATMSFDVFYQHIDLIYVKVKFTLEQATKAHRGSRGIALLLLQPRL
jgi:hypothetical protein